jgi:hypothetical protein
MVASSAGNLVTLNGAIRSAILANGVSRLQQLFSTSINMATQMGPINIAPNNVGIIRGFLVKLTGQFINNGADTASITAWGLANLISSFQFQDFSNVTRINTTGWHMNLLNSVKNNMPFAAAYAPNVSIGYGNNWGLQTTGASIATTATSDFSMYYYVPLAYSKLDLRGAVFAGLVGATAQLQLTINPNISAVAGDPTLAIWSGADTAVAYNTNVILTVYQDYIDQLPSYGQLGLTPPQGVGANSPALPPVDMSTIYELINTSQSGMVQSQDFGIPYTNLRTFMSTSVIYDNQSEGVYPDVGTDVNYWALTLANSANVWKVTADVADLLARGQLMADPPVGAYYFDHRSAPINTQIYGNAQLVLNASLVNTNAAVLIGYEAFAMTQTIVGAPSVPS